MAKPKARGTPSSTLSVEEAAMQNFGRFCLACGAFAPLLWGALVGLTALSVADYSHVRDLISELTWGDTASAALMRAAGFGLSGLLYVICAAYVAFRLRADRSAVFGCLLLLIGGVARLGAGIYPCDESCAPYRPTSTQDMHFLALQMSYGLLILSAFVWGVVVNRYQALRWFSTVSFGCATWSIVTVVMLVTQEAQRGQYERFATGLLSVWMITWVVALWRAGVWREDLAWRKPEYAPRRRKFRRP